MFAYAIKQLQDGKRVVIKPRGNSMRGKVESGDMVQLEPCVAESLCVGNVVLVKVKGRVFSGSLAINHPQFFGHR